MAKSQNFKQVVVREDAKTSMRSAKIHPLRLVDGVKISAVAHLEYPYHDRNMFEEWIKMLEVEKPGVVFLLGASVSEVAFRSLSIWDQEDNYLHDYPEVPEVVEALEAGLFEDRILHLANAAKENVFKRIAKATGGLVIWIPSWTHLAMGNEIRLSEWIQFTKRRFDSWMSNHPESSDVLSNPTVKLPKELDKLFSLENDPNVKVLRPGAGVIVNDKLLFMIGAFKRRHPGDASHVEWEQRGISIVNGFGGKISSGWFTRPKHTMPGLRLDYFQIHEIGYMHDPIHLSHYGDYERRASGFWFGRVVLGNVIGTSVPVIRGEDGRRSFVVNGKAYTESAPGCTHDGEELYLPGQLGSPEAISSRPLSPFSGSDGVAASGTDGSKAKSLAKARKDKATVKDNAEPKPNSKSAAKRTSTAKAKSVSRSRKSRGKRD